MISIRGEVKHLIKVDEGPLIYSESIKKVIFVQTEKIEEMWENLIEWGRETVYQGL